jgi:hypothetical protein
LSTDHEYLVCFCFSLLTDRVSFFNFSSAKTDLRASCMLGKCPATELHFQSPNRTSICFVHCCILST